MYTRIKTPQEIEDMRRSGKILAMVHNEISKMVKPGISTAEIAEKAESLIKKNGGVAVFKGYGYPVPFPSAVCVSVNEQVVHGIPSDEEILKNGDIVSLDLGVGYNGMITDSAISVICGKDYDPALDDFLKQTKKALFAGLKVVKNGCRTGDIGNAIQKSLEKNRLGIVRDLVGHGVGHEVHEDPNIPNFGKKGTGPKLVSGMTIAVEPMATLGNYAVYVEDDGWTVSTNDGSLSAHFEHTVLITDNGCEILTQL